MLTQEDGLSISSLWLLPAFLVPCAGAYRLARYNLDTSQSLGFKGVPIPAAGLLIASFPLIYWTTDNQRITDLLLNNLFWYAIILVVSYLMISKLPMMALKFKGLSIKNDLPKIILILLSIVAAIFFKWLAVPVMFVAYVIISLASKSRSESIINQ